jgi:DNA repair photolyase
MNAGLDFESRILVKEDAPRLLRKELNRPGWSPEETIAISGVTDCYQPAERKFRITRGLLEVLLEARQPCGIITKNALVLRDLDLIAQLAGLRLIHVLVTLTTLDAELARVMEPRTATPEARLRAVRELSAAGVPVGVMVAPIVPGLTDEEIPAILSAAAEAGARSAGWQMLRLPLAVEPIFRDWLAGQYPLKRERVEGLIRSVRDGNLSDSQFGRRMCGSGPYAEQIAATFKVFKKRFGLDRRLPELDATHFRPPVTPIGQKSLLLADKRADCADLSHLRRPDSKA